MNKYLIAGLGNIGEEYAATRHNIGFMVADFLAAESGVSFASSRYADVANMKYRGKQVILIKPNTYMNLSGKAVNYWLQKENISVDRLLVIMDDLALPFGEIRIKSKGGAGGHNGLSNIEEILGQQYARMRFGIGAEFNKGKQVDYVLGKFSKEETEKLPELLSRAKDAVLGFVSTGVELAMTNFNKK